MKYTSLFIFLLIISNCKEAKVGSTSLSDSPANKNFAPEWLLGDWERMGEKEGKQTYESWKLNKSGQYIGHGYTIQEQDTIWKENIVLSKNKYDIWTFDVTGKGDKISTSFVVIPSSKEKFICTNQLNDFPKQIEYAFENDEIHAVISGGGPKIPFNFKRRTPLKK